ncbi:MAG: ThiF family adenylyltransferase [Coriobacteriales bacterium]|jgi:adenylyltransferase/sulfurtransferase|nr:ThiF family adenylyltransferase [Coriobacteriales bacterium]
MMNRFARQIALAEVGVAGQRRLAESRVAIIGTGSLGTVSAELLARAGVGFLRLVDRDYVSLDNLPRSALFNEDDALQSKPKALAAADHLAEFISDAVIDPRVIDVNAATIEGLIADVDLVIDGTDNFEARYLLNDACHKLRKPWIHGAVLGTSGALMTIQPSGPCLRCFAPSPPPPGSYPTCASSGVIGAATALVATYQAIEALKLLLALEESGALSPGTTSGNGAHNCNESPAPLSTQYFSLDVWSHETDGVLIAQDPGCKTCVQQEYEFLDKPVSTISSELCGRDEFQVRPGSATTIDLNAAATRLRSQGAVTVSPFILTFDDGNLRFKLFKDGRAMIKGVASGEAALSVYADYIGL